MMDNIEPFQFYILRRFEVKENNQTLTSDDEQAFHVDIHLECDNLEYFYKKNFRGIIYEFLPFFNVSSRHKSNLTSDDCLLPSIGSIEHLCSRISPLHAKEETNISSCHFFYSQNIRFLPRINGTSFLTSATTNDCRR
jgi:hypothetical protein